MKNNLRHMNVNYFINKIIILLLISLANEYYSQGVGINNTGAIPDNSAALDISSTDKGLGLPVFNTVGRDTMHTPVNGLLIYNIDSKELNIHFSGTWFELITEDDVNTQAIGVGTAGYMAIGTTFVPHHSTALDLTSNDNRGLALPNAGLGSINSPAEGLISAPGKFRFFDGGKWKTIESSSIGLSNTSGNSPYGYFAIGTATPIDGASIAIQSSTQGVLPPRMTGVERDAIKSPIEGLFLYNTTEKVLQFWTGTIWKGLIPVIDGIFSDDAGADAYGIFSLDSVDVSVYRDAWRDKPGHNNSSPCNSSIGNVDLTSASITPPIFEQGGVMILSAPSGGNIYHWVAPNGASFIGETINLPADEVIADLAGEWSLIIMNTDNCIVSKKKIEVLLPLRSNVFSKGIFSGTTNNVDVNRIAWKDHPDSVNTGPCGDNLDLTGATISYPSIEQEASIIMNIGSPVSGAIYSWTSPNNNVYTGTSITIPNNLSVASHSGDWSLSVSMASCNLGGKLFDVKIALNPITQNKGIFSGIVNNTKVHRLAWKNHPDSLTIHPCSQLFDVSMASINAPIEEQTGVITLNAPIGANSYIWTSPNGTEYLGASVTISQDSAFSSHNGVWVLQAMENHCVAGVKEFPIHLKLRENVNYKSVFSGTTNNLEVHRLGWKDRLDSANTTPCNMNIDLTLSSIVAPSMEQQGSITLNAPAGTGTYTWSAPNGDNFYGNSTIINSNLAIASFNGEWILKVEEDGCLNGGKSFIIPISINDNHHNKGIFSGSVNNTEVHRLAWKDAPDSLNSTPCQTPFVDISSASITPPSLEQNGTLSYNVTAVIGNTYTWSTPLGVDYVGANGVLPPDEVLASLNGEWKLVVTNTVTGCNSAGIPILVHIPISQKTKEKGVFSGEANNIFAYRNQWINIDSICAGLNSIFDLSTVNISTPSAEQLGAITLNAPAGASIYQWTSPNGSSYTGDLVTIPFDKAYASHSGEWNLIVKNNDNCILGSSTLSAKIPLRTNHFSSGIFSGGTNNSNIRTNWRDINTNINTTP